MSKKSKIEAPKRPDPYAVDKLAVIPAWLKIGFLKFWVYGAVYYFIVFTLSGTLHFLDLWAVQLGVMILAIEYIGNTLIVWMHTEAKPTLKYLPHEINRKSVWSLLATALYTTLLFVVVQLTLLLWVDVWGLPTIGDLISESTADPITFSLLFLALDTLWVASRNAMKHLRKKG
ncbi:MAG TPA: hypothetical protein P5154_04250 [Candidatus Izemoplasmatales bacterium]|nr:hypothetical protein [Candidatus Izemoplasmatales bacterium]